MDELAIWCMGFAETCPYPVAIFHGRDHRLLFANPPFCTLTGKTAAELEGVAVAVCLPQCPECVALLTRVSERGISESHTEAGYSDSWSYSAWPVFPVAAAGVILLQITETSQLHQRSASVNEALLVSALEQHELAQKAQDTASQMSSEVSQRTAELDHTKEELRWLALQLLQAQEDERQRIARELHDRFGQELASIGMQLSDLATPVSAHAGQRAAVVRLQDQIGRLSTEIRTLSHELHSTLR